jgi:hypothetical protein
MRRGGFHDVASLRAELGADVAGLSDDEAREFVNANLVQKASIPKEQRDKLDKLHPELHGYKEDNVVKEIANNWREKADREEAERRRVQRELDAERYKPTTPTSVNVLWRSPGSLSTLDDFLYKEKLKREVKDELTAEELRKQRQRELEKSWAADSKPKRSPRKRSKSPKAKGKKKSPRKKSKSPKAKK